MTQMPLPTTVLDLWTLIHDHRSKTIVMLNPLDPLDEVREGGREGGREEGEEGGRERDPRSQELDPLDEVTGVCVGGGGGRVWWTGRWKRRGTMEWKGGGRGGKEQLGGRR